MNWTLIGIMLGLLATLLTVYKRRETVPKATEIVLGCFFCVVICCYFFLKDAGILGDKSKQIILNEAKYRSAAVYTMCKEIVKKHKAGDVLVIIRGGINDHFEGSAINIIKDFFKGTNRKVAFVPITDLKKGVSSPEMEYMEEDLVSGEDYVALLKKHSGYPIVFSLVDMPYEDGGAFLSSGLINDSDLYFLTGDVNQSGYYIQQQLIDAVVIWKPGIKFNREEAPDDFEEAFAKRYVIVTSENVRQYAEEMALEPPVKVKLSKDNVTDSNEPAAEVVPEMLKK